MFCKYCGQPTNNANAVCDDCAPRSTQKPITVDKKYGFKGALTSTILGAIGFIIAVVCYVYAVVFLAVTGAELAVNEYGSILEETNGYYSELIAPGIGITVAIVFSIVGFCATLPFAILSLIKGIKAIKAFKEAKALGVKPVATLILGIVGTVCAAGMFVFLAFFPFILMGAASLAWI